jgi:predicted O-methyltransferase YrrM
MFVFWAFFGGHQDSEQLASGSFGVVFLAKDKKTNQQALPPSENALAKATLW